MVAEPSQYSSDFGHSFKMKINEISLYFNGLRFHLSILPKSNYLPLCCFTGLAFTDVKNLKKEHLVQADNGEWWIRKAREKTDNMCDIPLLDIPRLILEKYQSNPICNEKGLLLPVPSNQRMNSYLKEIADVCGIQKNLSTHIARHTFASLAIANKVSLESIAKMLGHTDIRTTRIYAKIMNSTIANEMKVLQNKFAI